MTIPYKKCMEQLKKEISKGKPIIGTGAGIGLSAKCAEEGGADLIIVYNSGRYRMAGRGSLSGMMPYGDANQIVVEMGQEVLTIVEDIPVLAGVCGTDPFRHMPTFIRQLKEQGFSGVQNFPTVGLIDGLFRQNLEETNMGYDLEVKMIAEAHQAGLLTCPYVFKEDEAIKMVNAGADILVAHMGLTTSGSIGARTSMDLEEAINQVQAIHDAATSVRDDILILCHGGPIASPTDAANVLEETTGIVGFFGASSIERLPTERSLTQEVKNFKLIRG